MDRRSESAVNDAVLDREIERALAADPAADFVARVRRRVAREPAPSIWRVSWGLYAGAAAALVIVFVMVDRHRHEPADGATIVPLVARSVGGSTPAIPPSIVSRHLPAVASIGIAVKPGAASSLAVLRESRAASMDDAAKSRAAARAVVLIEPSESAALRHLLAGTRRDRVEARVIAASDQEGSPAVTPLQPPREIAVAPLAQLASINIEPLASVAREEGVRQ